MGHTECGQSPDPFSARALKPGECKLFLEVTGPGGGAAEGNQAATEDALGARSGEGAI